MTSLKAKVRNGRLTVDEPTELPEGSEIELIPIDGWDDLDDEGRRRLHESLAASEEDVANGGTRAAADVLADLFSHRHQKA
jgi:hypothetical protein